MLKRQQIGNRGPVFRILTPDQCHELNGAAREILEQTGVNVFHAEARELLQKAGAIVEGNTVRIPSSLIDESLRSAPKRIVLSDRNGENRLFLEGRNVYFSPVVANQLYHDPHTRKIRESARKDLSSIITVADYLSKHGS